MTTTYSIDEVLAHRSPMSLLGHIDSYGDDWLKAKAVVKADNLFVEDGKMPSWVGIEYMAQSIGAFVGVQARLKNQLPQLGFLVGTRKFQCNLGYLPVDSELNIHISVVLSGGNGLGVFNCRIEASTPDNQRMEAKANLKVYQPDNIVELLRAES